MQRFKRISAHDAKALIEESGAIIADIRDSRSFEAGRIRGAHLVDNHNVQDFFSRLTQDTHLIVCCYHGNMSQSAAQFFAQQGVGQVYSLDGGFAAWCLLFPDQIDT